MLALPSKTRAKEPGRLKTMKSFSEWSPASDPHFAERRVLCFDLDDTLTSHGALGPEVCSALARAQAAGWVTVLVTGRPAGWADALVKLLPFDAVVAENGSVLFVWEGLKKSRRPRQEPRKLFWHSDGTFQADIPSGLRDRHAETARAILAAYPRARVASDQPYRLYDLAIDFAEEVDPPLGLRDAEGIAQLFAKFGATAKVSSIHVNGWWGTFSKAEGLDEALERLGPWNAADHAVYVGDSPNDAPLFRAAGVSVGVANVKEFLGVKDFAPPAYVTRQERADGALEVIERAIHSPRADK